MTDPVALATTIWGDGPHRALLIHGLTSAASTWWRVGPRLAALGFSVVAPDLRGHGRSPKGGSLSIDSHRDDVRLLGRGWDLVIGHSLGGAIATSVVAADPAFAARLILEDPALDSKTTAEFIAASLQDPAYPTTAAIAAANPDWHPTDVAVKVEALLACGPDIAERTLADAAPWDLWGALASLRVPALVIAADVALGTLVDDAAEAGLDAAFHRVAGAGHSVHRESHETFMALVEGFVGT